MAAGVARQAAELAAGARRWRSRYQRAEDDLIAAARGYAEETGSPDFDTAGAGTAGPGTAGPGGAGAGTAGAGTAGRAAAGETASQSGGQR